MKNQIVCVVNTEKLYHFLLLSLSSLLLSMQIRKIHSLADELKIWRNRSVVTPSCFPSNKYAFFSFLFRCRKLQATWFFLSFFLKYFAFSYTDVHTERYTCVLYYLEIFKYKIKRIFKRIWKKKWIDRYSQFLIFTIICQLQRESPNDYMRLRIEITSESNAEVP